MIAKLMKALRYSPDSLLIRITGAGRSMAKVIFSPKVNNIGLHEKTIIIWCQSLFDELEKIFLTAGVKVLI